MSVVCPNCGGALTGGVCADCGPLTVSSLFSAIRDLVVGIGRVGTAAAEAPPAKRAPVPVEAIRKRIKAAVLRELAADIRYIVPDDLATAVYGAAGELVMEARATGGPATWAAIALYHAAGSLDIATAMLRAVVACHEAEQARDRANGSTPAHRWTPRVIQGGKGAPKGGSTS